MPVSFKDQFHAHISCTSCFIRSQVHLLEERSLINAMSQTGKHLNRLRSVLLVLLCLIASYLIHVYTQNLRFRLTTVSHSLKYTFQHPFSTSRPANDQMGSLTHDHLDLLRLTASDLQNLMQDNQLSSVNLVQQVLEQIEKHNEAGAGVRAMISVAPKDVLISRASTLDEERSSGRLRGPLHGIPIIVKVSSWWSGLKF